MGGATMYAMYAMANIVERVRMPGIAVAYIAQQLKL
jgi:hypothetical protein